MYKLHITLGNKKVGEVKAGSLSSLSRSLHMWAQNHISTIDELNQWYLIYVDSQTRFELQGRTLFRGNFRITSKTELDCDFEII